MMHHQLLSTLCFVLILPTVRASCYQLNAQEQLLPTTLGKIPAYKNGTALYTRNSDQFYVNINVSTGIVSTLAPINREEIDLIRIFIVNEAAKQIICEISIQIIDINDNAPEFSESIKHIFIPESLKVGHSLSLRAPFDKDSGYNGMISNITCSNNDTQFIIRYDQQNSKYFSLVLKEAIDREKEPFIAIELTATDSGSPPLTSKTTINITIQDINDNHPTFPKPIMSLSISEATEINTSLISVNATDLDDGDNAKISYTLTLSGDEYLGDNYFMIDTHTGVVRLIKRLVYEENTFFELAITATDHGSPKLASSASLRISITDSNNHAPTISLPKHHLVIKEHNPIGQFLTYVTIHDQDSIDGNFSLQLLNHQLMFIVKRFQHNRKQAKKSTKIIQYYLKINQSIKYKTQPFFEINLRATDGLYETYDKLLIQVENINNHPPTFDKHNNETNFSIQSPMNSYVATMHATDADFNGGGNITYRLAPSTLSNHFNISDTGVILLQKPLPSRKLGFINFTISAMDHQTPSKETLASLSIRILNKQNACQPRIVNYPRQLELSKAHFFKKVATYYSTEPNNKCFIVYSLEKNIKDTVFTINDMGELELHKIPGNVEQPINITIGAHNLQNLRYYETVSTIVTFTKRKVTSIQVEFQKPFYFVQLPTGAKIGYFITQTLLTPTTATANYFIEGETRDFLRIDGDGRIYIKEHLTTVNTCNVYMVKAVVNPTRNISTILMHSTQSKKALSKEGSEIFLRDIFSFELKELSPKGWVISKIGLNHPTTAPKHFHIEPSETSSLFTIDDDGYLKLKQPLQNVNKKFLYKLNITLATNCTLYRVPVKVRLQDLNNHSPYFTSPSFANLTSYRPTLHPVYHATAHDLDIGHNGQLTFKMTQNGNGYFCMDKKSGHIYLHKTIHSKERRVFELKLRVSDHGQPQKSSTKKIYLVWNGNVDSGRVTRIHIHLNKTIRGKGFFRLPTSDTTYFIKTYSDIFGVYPNNWLYVKSQTLKQNYYKLLIKEGGGGEENQNKRNDVTVYITTDSNKPRQIFHKSFYTFAVDKTYTGVVIANISLSTNDDNKTVLYMAEVNDYIDIVGRNQLLLKSKLDCRLLGITNCQIIFPISGVLNGTKETSVVKIKVIDQNNHESRFVSNHVTYELSSKDDRTIPSGVLEIVDQTLETNFLYSIQNQNCSSVAHINSTNGEIQFDRPLTGDCLLRIIVYDPHFPSRNDTTELFVYSIHQKNITIPQYKNITLNVSESVPLGTVIYQYPDSSSNLDFKINSLSTNFLVHPITGSVILVRELDYEKQKTYSLGLLINEKANNYIFINVSNENDNQPVPKERDVKLTIQDDTAVGSVIFSCIANDLDGDVLHYSINWEVAEGEDFFDLNKNNCSLRSKRDLMELELSETEFQISISDGDHMVKIDVNLIIERVSIPKVLSPSACLVPANADSGTVLYEVEVQAAYQNQIKEYSIQKGLVSHLFHLNTTTRQLHLQQQWLNQHNYIILTLLLTTKANVQNSFKLFIFKEVNGDMTFTSDTYLRSISENKVPNYDLIQVKVKKPSFSSVKYHIVSGAFAYYLKLDENSGQITVPVPIDREITGPKIKVTIYAIDLKNYQSAFTEVLFIIDGVNDNVPRFGRHPSEVWVTENEKNLRILQLNATDLDEGDKVSYQITSGNIGNLFTLQSDGWLVLANLPLDYEQQKTFSLDIVASDNGVPSLTAKTTIKIYVTDQNDNTPSFIGSQPYYFEIPESFPVESTVGKVTATDLDSGQNGAVRYKIVTGNYEYFDLDPSSGQIHLMKPLSCSEICAFYLEIQAEDHGNEPRIKNSAIVINVIPELEQILNTHQYNIVIPYYLSIKSKVVALNISPAKFLYNKKMFFSILDNNAFWVSDDGVIYLRTSITNTANQMQLLVKASRNQCASDFELATINISIKKNNWPTFSSIRKVFFVPEDDVIGSAIGNVTVILDTSRGSNGGVTYRLVDLGTSNYSFTMDLAGTLRLARKLDYEGNNQFILTVEASFKDKPSFTSTQTVYIFVEDCNDNYPQFNSLPSIISIPTDRNPYVEIIQIQAFDLDSGANGRLEYQLLSYTEMFRINATNGLIFIQNGTFKDGDEYEIIITVKDGGKDQPKSNSTSVVFRFYEENTPPKFVKHYHFINITENQEPVNQLHKFEIIDRDRMDSNRQQNRFQFLTKSKSETVREFFSLCSTTGALSQLKSLDREINSGFEFHVVLYDRDVEADRTLIRIAILDLNDCPPEILENQQGSIPEHSLPNTYIMSVQAFDKDSGQNGFLQYSIKSYPSKFDIDNQNGILTVKKDLDREIQSHYEVVVIVEDSAPPYHSTNTTVVITIEDVNDQTPKFIAPSEMIIAPQSPTGTYLTTLQASDDDTQTNSKMVFLTNDSSIFIDRDLGTVNLAKPATYVSFFFKARVIDPTRPNFGDTINVKVHVQKSQYPSLKNSKKYYFIVENDNHYLHNVIHRVETDDQNKTLRYDIVSNNQDEFRINHTSGEIFLQKPLDYESQKLYIIWMSACDVDSPKFKSHQRIVIFVNNTNDNIPSFTHSETTIQIREDSTNRTLDRIQAFDLDDGDKIYYFLSPSHENSGYTINRTTGVIYRNFDLDFETKEQYNLTIYATNDPTGKSRDRIQMFLHIDILNVNDEVPRFINPPQTLEIPENFTIGTPIHTFATVDDDNLSLLTISTSHSDYFYILPNGQLSLLKSLDREVLGTNQSLIITLNDGVHSTNHNLTLIIRDINDSPPQFTSINFTIEFPEDTKEGAQIFRFQVHDADEGKNAISKLEMITPEETLVNIYQNFLLYNNGSLVTRKNFTIIGKPIEFNFQIRATNTEPPYFTRTTNVTIKVSDLNDHAPVFEKQFYRAYVQADVPTGQNILSVNATDNFDIGRNALVNYSITKGNGTSFFSIDSHGNIAVSKSLKSLTGQILIVIVNASNSGNSSLSSTCVARHMIEQVNKNKPQVYDEPYIKQVFENQTLYKPVFQIKADDYESKADLKFEVINLEEHSVWSIHDNGSLFLHSPLDFETQTNYTLFIKITDGSISLPRFATAKVHIFVRDVNDVAPVFDQERYNIVVAEDFNTSQSLLRAQAADVDPLNALVSYSIPKEAISNFWINSSTGELFSKTNFNYEKQNSYTLNIEASDNGSPIMKSVAIVTINITGVNEYKPRFDVPSYFFNISRLKRRNEVIGSVKALDRDKGRDGESFYKITAPLRNGISLNPLTGNLVVYRRPLSQIQTVRVLAFNKNRQDFFDHTKIRIKVSDFTGAPVFEKETYTFSVYENTTLQSLVCSVSANYYNGDNSGLSYGIVNNLGEFNIDSQTGQITLKSLLDYEKTKLYEFQVYAKNGNHPKGFAQIRAEVLDYNDNLPRPIDETCFGNISENIAPGYTIIPRIAVTDADSTQNGDPFHFSLNDNTDKFEIDASSGMLRNRISLDREDKPRYNISIRITDSGQPPLSTLYNCVINIQDVNDNKGTSRRTDILVTQYSFRKIGFGDVSPIDPDLNDRYQCELETESNLFEFDTDSCFLRLRRSAVSEFPDSTVINYFGQHRNEEKIKSRVSIKTRRLEEAWFLNNVALYVSNMEENTFISSHFYGTEKHLNQEFSNKLISTPTIGIASVKDFQNGVIIVLLTNREVAQNEDLIRYHLKKNLEKLGRFLGQEHSVSIFDACAVNSCDNTKMICESQFIFTDYIIQETRNLLLHGRDFNIKKQCLCKAGRVGLRCSQVPERCSDLPCHANGRCENLQNGVSCHCPGGLTGKYCDVDVNECLSSPCQQGSTCINKHGRFFCVCDEKHEGQLCESTKSPCSYNPCFNNGKCSKSFVSETKYECKCRFGDWGSRCEKQSWNFGPTSWVEVVSNTSSGKVFQMVGEFASVEKHSLLAWTYNKDWNLAVGIINGIIQVSMETMTSSIILESDILVVDGLFHAFEVQFDGKELKLKIDAHEVSRRIGSQMKKTTDLTHLVYIGGLKNENEIRSLRQLNFTSVEFIGCMRRLFVNGALLNDEFLYEHSDGVTLGSKRKESVCDGDMCGYGNQCIDRWSHYECRCRENGVLAKGCLRDDISVGFLTKGSAVRVRLTDSQRRKILLKETPYLLQQNKRKLRNQVVELTDRTSNLLSIRFRTREDDAILFNSTDTHGKTLISIKGGQIFYSFTTNNNGMSGRSTIDKQIADGQWHQVLLKAQPRSIELALDGNLQQRYTFKEDVHRFIALSVEEYMFGEHFLGCLGKIVMNNDSFVLGVSNNVFKIENSSIKRGCIPTDFCSHRPCVNNALSYCVDTWESFKCVKPGLCLEEKCQNGGRCVPGLASFSCDCTRIQYGGKRCEVPLACLGNPCKSEKKCLANGPTYKCVVLKPRESDKNMGYLIAIILSSVIILIIFAIGIAFLSSKKRWKEKEFRADMYKEGFENEGVVHYQDPTIEANDAYGNDERPIQEAVLPYRSRNNKKTSHSLPELREKPFSILKNRYKSAEQFHRHANDGGNIERPLSGAYENDVYSNPCPPPQGESGFNSSYSEGESSVDENSSMYYSTSVAAVELYDIERASMQFSEMSFKHDPPIKNNPVKTLRHFHANQGYVSDSSDAYFTSSEFEYGKRNSNRKNPAFILNEQNKRNLKNGKSDQGGGQSESDAWSHESSTLFKGKQTLELRERILREQIGKKAKRNYENNETSEQFSEAEEFV